MSNGKHKGLSIDKRAYLLEYLQRSMIKHLIFDNLLNFETISHT